MSESNEILTDLGQPAQLHITSGNLMLGPYESTLQGNQLQYVCTSSDASRFQPQVTLSKTGTYQFVVLFKKIQQTGIIAVQAGTSKAFSQKSPVI